MEVGQGRVGGGTGKGSFAECVGVFWKEGMRGLSNSSNSEAEFDKFV